MQKDLHEVVFHAGWAPETKTVLQEDGSVWWSPGDEISLFVGSSSNGGYKLTSVETAASARADFMGEIPPLNGREYVAIYPFDESTQYNETSGIITLTLPERQIARENNFPDKSFKSLAVSKNDQLYFRNLFSGIKFSVANEGIKEIEFAVTQDVFLPDCSTCLSGRLLLNKEGELTYKYGNSKVTIVAPDNQCFVPGKYYFITIPARTFENGLIITYRKELTEATLVLDKEVTFKKSVFKRLYAKDEGLTFHQRATKHATIPHFGSMLPNGIDKTMITEAHFFVSSDKTTDTILDTYPDNTSEPIYFELNGTVANYYTPGEVYKVARAADLFAEWRSLKTLDLSSFDVSACNDFSYMFSGCLSLKEIKFGDFNTSNAKSLVMMFYCCLSLESIDLSGFNTCNVQDMNYMFLNCQSLRELDLSNFDTHNVRSMGEMFERCYRLEKLDISSFTSDKLEYGPGLFCYCYSLLKLNMGSFDISKIPSNAITCYKLASRSRNCAILCSSGTREAMLSEEAALMSCVDYIQWFSPGEILPDLSMNYNPDLYYSADYSKDKIVKMLNVASAGNGIDVVLVGDAYSDRLIDDGTYEQDMIAVMEHLFSVEPLKSFRHLFNVYMVTAVSENEVMGEFTALGSDINNWTGQGESDDIQINEYVSQAVGRDENRIVTPLIVINDFSGQGLASISGGPASDEDHYDYPAKLTGPAWICKSTDVERFRYVVCHEFGHAFAGLHDEYVEMSGEMETWEFDSKKWWQSHAGWYANVSFTSDPSQVGWRRFLEEGSGYNETEVSIIEGALYSQGIWRSVDQSMMNAGGEFSVPAREAIYKRIHKIAFGDEWQYSFEDFVAWDRSVIPPVSQTTSSNLKAKNVPYPARVNRKPVFKMKESTTADGKKMIRVIMN